MQVLISAEINRPTLSGSRVTSNLFSMLGAQAEHGRTFAADETQ